MIGSSLLFFLAATEASAFELGLPVACALGSECHVRQIVDRDPQGGAADFTCGSLTYDGHRGVDFGLPTLEAMRNGVDVLAAAPGIVAATRDGMPDRIVTEDTRARVEGRECGNGVVIDHGDGWTTQYCHLARGSIAVRSEDRVGAGQKLGQIGLSGLTQFPHVHLAVRKDGVPIDPFDARPTSEGCKDVLPQPSLWSPASGIEYKPGGALAAGLTESVPDYGDIQDHAPHSLSFSIDAPAIVAWGHFYGLRPGDEILTRLLAPTGEVLVEDRHVMNRSRATQFRAAGLRRPEGGWPEGTYRGISELLRDGQAIASIEAEATVP